METGICRRCGCKWNTACVDEMYGSCWWVDKNRTLCSHCFYGFNNESCQTKVYYRPGHDWLERDWEFAGAEELLSLWINFIIYGSLEIGVRKNNEKHRNK